MSTPPRNPQYYADLQKEIDKADRRRIDQWHAAMRREGRVVLRTNLFKTFAMALICWLFVGAIILTFTVTPTSTWNPMSPGFGGWPVFFFLVVFAIGLVLFGIGALLWTFVFPFVRPQFVVSRWGVESSWWKPGRRGRQFATPWSGVVDIGGEFQWRKYPFPDALVVTITARGATAHQNALIGTVRRPEMVTYRVLRELKAKPRDVLVFLREVHGAQAAHY
ncbi:hypothetical protein SAMN04489752_0942 [Brevibacterium siliguriense]|uniref:Uncharacterized protein n=1 Tax=Brevibacterium siliguriense TaxID=1136497 RepID=A0A1H1PAM2_9MICO|nr:hypothetical protein [Brevibacterium siliguriense]SDS08301.1 hypothetical protein SAMN04489752_0942 [Brevibacterium siliguriense]